MAAEQSEGDPRKGTGTAWGLNFDPSGHRMHKHAVKFFLPSVGLFSLFLSSALASANEYPLSEVYPAKSP